MWLLTSPQQTESRGLTLVPEMYQDPLLFPRLYSKGSITSPSSATNWAVNARILEPAEIISWANDHKLYVTFKLASSEPPP